MIALVARPDVLVLVGAVFLAAAVEMVEALTIVLAVGQTREWRSALWGSGAAFVALTAVVATFGPALVRVPLNDLRLVAGGVLLVFGMQWLRKAILRSAGLVAKHDKDAAYRAAVVEIEGAPLAQRDRVAVVMAFKGVFLEGLEVVITVLTLGTSTHRLGLAAAVAAAAVVLVGLVGMMVARQLSRVPENAMKTMVGTLLVSYGTFWTGEGLRVRWPGGDVMLLGFVALYLGVTGAFVVALRPRRVRGDGVPA